MRWWLCLFVNFAIVFADDETCANGPDGQCSAGGKIQPPPLSNAPRPPAQAGDRELRSTVPDVLPGATPVRLHGLLGRLDNGTLRFKRRRLPADGLTDEMRVQAHTGFCFNSRVSESISVDRDQKDVRSQACQRLHQEYPKQLPSASVIFVFHNENLAALLRSIHSVLNHSPPEQLKEILVLDDSSVVDQGRFSKEHWAKLQQPLDEYIVTLPKVTLVRLRKRRGLMMARMEGAWRASGDSLIFLDSHIEATPGWIEPLLARLADDPRRLLVPKIDSIDGETFAYRQAGGLGAISFTWNMGQKPLMPDYGRDGTKPAKSPVMPGGLFAADREWFMGLGGYDPEMRLYGGEEMEISFRTWMCGGSIESVPCSHVGHIFRLGTYCKDQAYSVPAKEIHRNKLRTAEVWMDSYKLLSKNAMMPLPMDFIGNLSQRQELRDRLQCKNFKWFLKNVAPDVPIPRFAKPLIVGPLRNLGLKRHGNLCLDTLGNTLDGQAVGLFSCHGQNGAQAFAQGQSGKVLIPVLDYTKCLSTKSAVIAGLKEASDEVAVVACSKAAQAGSWRWDGSRLTFADKALAEYCLEGSMGDGGKPDVKLADCVSGKLEQTWQWGDS